MSHVSYPVPKDHVWAQVFESANRFTKPMPTLFLDRDGVIVEEVHYLSKVEDVALIDGAASVIKKANDLDIPVVIVTNQAGIARGMFDWAAFDAVQNQMFELLDQENGAFVDAVYACPFHKVGQPPYGVDNHEARKPNPGMLLRAMKDIKIDAEQSVIIGDKAGDLLAGKNAGLKAGFHVTTGHGMDEGEREKAMFCGDDSFQVHVGSSIADFLEMDLLF
jgi:D-glycero-D-manno-heptose 1,7-bisphosphate phosphatase